VVDNFLGGFFGGAGLGGSGGAAGGHGAGAGAGENAVPPGATNADTLYPEAPAQSQPLGATPTVPATGRFESPQTASATFGDLVTNSPPAANSAPTPAPAAGNAAPAANPAFDPVADQKPEQILQQLQDLGYSGAQIANLNQDAMRAILTDAVKAPPEPNAAPQQSPAAAPQMSQPAANNGGIAPVVPPEMSQPAPAKVTSEDLSDLTTSAPSAPSADTNVVAEADIPAADSGETVHVQLTRKGPWDFNDTLPAPDEKTVEALRKEGRPNVYDETNTPADRAHAVSSTLDEALSELQDHYAHITDAQRTIEDIQTGKAKLKRSVDPEQAIGKLRTSIQNAQTSIDNIGGEYESHGFSPEAVAAMRTEAQNRADANAKSSPVGSEQPTPARKTAGVDLQPPKAKPAKAAKPDTAPEAEHPAVAEDRAARAEADRLYPRGWRRPGRARSGRRTDTLPTSTWPSSMARSVTRRFSRCRST
jgi:hypothetical protein